MQVQQLCYICARFSDFIRFICVKPAKVANTNMLGYGKQLFKMDFVETQDKSQARKSESLGFLTKLEDLLGHDLKILEQFVQQGYHGLLEKRKKRIRQGLEYKLEEIVEKDIRRLKEGQVQKQKESASFSNNVSSSSQELVTYENNPQIQDFVQSKAQQQKPEEQKLLVPQFVEPRLYQKIKEYYGEEQDKFLKLQQNFEKTFTKGVKKQQKSLKRRLDFQLKRTINMFESKINQKKLKRTRSYPSI